jgi:hypothetical protein
MANGVLEWVAASSAALTRALWHLFGILNLGQDRNTFPSLQSLAALTIHKQVKDSGRDLNQVVFDLEKTHLPHHIASDLRTQYYNIQHALPTSAPYPVSFFCNTEKLSRSLKLSQGLVFYLLLNVSM